MDIPTGITAIFDRKAKLEKLLEAVNKYLKAHACPCERCVHEVAELREAAKDCGEIKS